jgi:hypothetical protein
MLKEEDMRSIRPNQTPPADKIIRSFRAFPIDLLKVYPSSLCSKNGLMYGLIRTQEGKKMAVMGERSHVLKDGFGGRCYHQASSLKICDFSAENTGALMTLFPYTKPISLREYPMTIGTGDRLGVATPGHIRAIKKFQVHPVLAQQSAAENVQTGRDFVQVIQDAAWAVFQENYQEGYGADADHLRSLQEVKSALDAGVSMVTLDLSEKISPDILQEPKDLIDRKFREEVDEGDARVIFHLFLDKEFSFAGPHEKFSIRFNEESVKRNTLLFHTAFGFAEEVYELIRSRTGNRPLVDLGICLDEMPFPTSPENHFFLALELSHRGVHIQSLTPRFLGAFEKGIDYPGNEETFRTQFYQHALIAQDEGNYKISVRSGINKFSVFPDTGELPGRGFHLKTAATAWLEAIRLIALVNPSLYREIHRYVLSIFNEVSSVNRITRDLKRIPKLEDLQDQELSTLLDRKDLRQLLDITCGYLLKAKNEAGEYLFKHRLYHTLMEYEEDYWSLLEERIEKQLRSLGVAPQVAKRISAIAPSKERQKRGSKYE